MADTTPITLADLTDVSLTGKGAFDQLMASMRIHLKKEFDDGRLKGPEYAQVLSGSITAILQNAVMFLLQKDEAANKSDLVKAQIDLTKAQAELIQKQIDAQAYEKELIQAKVRLTDEQAKLPAAQVRQIEQAIKSALLQDEVVKVQKLQVEAQTQLVNKQVEQATQEIVNLQQTNLNLIAQECLLRSQYDLTMEQKLNTTAQTTLVSQKTATEKAQVVGAGVDVDSVIGRQKGLYLAQTEGFSRDAEQKATKILTDTWNVRRTTDEGTIADATNMLYDASIGRAVNRMLSGIKA